MARPPEHSRPSNLKVARGHQGDWLRKLASLKLKPIPELLETVQDGNLLNQAETWNIIYYRSLGYDLTNSTLGGEGMSGYDPPESTREKLRVANSGRPRPQSVKDQISFSQKGKIYPNRINGIREWHKNNKASEETRKIRAINASCPVMSSVGVMYGNTNEASKHTGICTQTIRRNLKINETGKPEKTILKYGIGFALVNPKRGRKL